MTKLMFFIKIGIIIGLVLVCAGVIIWSIGAIVFKCNCKKQSNLLKDKKEE